MKVVRTISEARAMRSGRERLALVPTMGALHAGHLSLIAIAKKQAPSVAVSIFVNPTQFGPREDFTKYPRPVEQDLAKCEQAGVDWVFLPEASEMYKPGLAEVMLDMPQLAGVLEGAKRPGHFRGVCQVVAKLFNIIHPDVAVFGQKDYQQLRIITAMVEALDWPVQIVSGPTVREPDGLAMSSRNQYLSETERQKALSISRALFLAKGEFTQGVRQANRLVTSMQHVLLEQHLLIDYIAAVDPITLKPVDTVNGPTVLAVAARVGNTRLIDNVVIG
ncbi:MAG TPA: pantoate--beta-alanine ligase [Tepidisphaeraceae bacterium]|nr:pantoate--beta-alanine ligase [Tepidisphaeraceae bacterium]